MAKTDYLNNFRRSRSDDKNTAGGFTAVADGATHSVDDVLRQIRLGRITCLGDFLDKYEIDKDLKKILEVLSLQTSVSSPIEINCPETEYCRLDATDEEGKKIRAVLFFDHKFAVSEKEAKEVVGKYGIDPGKFRFCKYATRGKKLIPGTPIDDVLGEWSTTE